MGYKEEILRRRTFGIISHPDAGKTTLTEKLLLFGGAIHVAGAVKSNKIKKTDDGFEFFGGSVNAKYLVVTDCEDDSFDWTEGWNGKAQFLVATQVNSG